MLKKTKTQYQIYLEVHARTSTGSTLKKSDFEVETVPDLPEAGTQPIDPQVLTVMAIAARDAKKGVISTPQALEDLLDKLTPESA